MEIRENSKVAEQIKEMENMMSNFAKDMKGRLETKTATIDDIETLGLRALEQCKQYIKTMIEETLSEEGKKN